MEVNEASVHSLYEFTEEVLKNIAHLTTVRHKFWSQGNPREG